jgi:lysophospholipid acyltransferase (LPLAT)-like uncharacterized protein
MALLAAALIRLLRATVRLRHDGDATVRAWEREGRRFILAFWHRHMLLMRYCYRGERVTMLISRHRDGELIARTIGRLGVDSTRGSTSSGGASGLRGLLRKAAQGYDLGFTPDGPRGPAAVVKPGVVMAAAATGRPIQPVGFAARPCLRLRSWDRFVVPLPLGRAWLVYGEPLLVERGCDLEAAARELAARLVAAESRAERLVERRRRR